MKDLGASFEDGGWPQESFGEGTGDMDGSLLEFIEQWKLQEEAQSVLFALPPEAQAKVMKEFAPRDISRDANSIFIKFAQGVGGASHNGDSEAFIAQWGLNEEARSLLASLPPTARNKVMAEFAPRDTERDANMIFLKFARGVAAGAGKGWGGGWGKGWGKGMGNTPWGAPATQQPLHPALQSWQLPTAGSSPSVAPNQVLAIRQFAGQWGLREEAQAVLLALAPEVRDRVMQEFSPRDVSRDANSIFIKFAQGVEQNCQGEPLGTFIARWQLGPEAQTLLSSLPPQARQKVITQFAPRDAQNDVNNIFMKFAQGVMRGGKGGKGDGKAGEMMVTPPGGPAARFSPY
mmetsp:Transcript_40185/g.87826  ORF Transcript_40185/g.87826 Transcript_40185/m.87826 type:complete len:347 (-) Transcript_40185:146-1186(-)